MVGNGRIKQPDSLPLSLPVEGCTEVGTERVGEVKRTADDRMKLWVAFARPGGGSRGLWLLRDALTVRRLPAGPFE